MRRLHGGVSAEPGWPDQVGGVLVPHAGMPDLFRT